jgi:hypothetical protein
MGIESRKLSEIKPYEKNPRGILSLQCAAKRDSDTTIELKL